MGVIHTTIIIEDLEPTQRFYLPASPPPPPPPPPPSQKQKQKQKPVAISRASAPEKILGLHYMATGAVVPLVDARGAYVPADAKSAVWVPGMGMWVAGPECVFK